jgi:sugar/nucleoside kinase (ribokinase family)
MTKLRNFSGQFKAAAAVYTGIFLLKNSSSAIKITMPAIQIAKRNDGLVCLFLSRFFLKSKPKFSAFCL